MNSQISINSQNIYEVTIQGGVEPAWLAWYEGLEMHTHDSNAGVLCTTLGNIQTDQAGLVGLIRWLHGLGVVFLTLRQVGEGLSGIAAEEAEQESTDEERS